MGDSTIHQQVQDFVTRGAEGRGVWLGMEREKQVPKLLREDEPHLLRKHTPARDRKAGGTRKERRIIEEQRRG